MIRTAVINWLISPGIKSIRNDTEIRLHSNQLTRFESTVFKSLLETMAPFGGYPNASVSMDYSKFLSKYSNDIYIMWLNPQANKRDMVWLVSVLPRKKEKKIMLKISTFLLLMMMMAFRESDELFWKDILNAMFWTCS